MQNVVEVLGLLGPEDGEAAHQPLKGRVHVLAALLLCPGNQVPEGIAIHSSHSSMPSISMSISSGPVMFT